MHLRNLPFRFRLWLTAGLILMSWLALMLPFGSIVIVGAAIWGVALARIWRKALPLLAIALSPMAVRFATGVAEWFSPRPQFHYVGLPGSEFFNLDPNTRCYAATGGCLATGNEWITQGPHNFGLRMMGSLFGPPRATYHGPYPTREEAMALAERAEVTPIGMFERGAVLIDGKPIFLGSNIVTRLALDLDSNYFGAPGSATNQVRAALFQQSCVVVRIQTTKESSDMPGIKQQDGIYLFNRADLRPFARWVIRGRANRIPRLLTRFD